MLNNKISKAVRLAIAFGAVTATAFTAAASDEENIEKIEITGSSIKGTDLAGALPVNVISAEDIKATGVTSVPDLVAQIPSMQGFTTPVSSVGGGGAGVASAALRGLDDSYTLVLLNGRRLAPSGAGTTVNLNSIPLAAVERVEVLTDGASALYGSDAIAGVINFILKSDVDQTTVAVRLDRPEEDGSDKTAFSITSGFGDIDADGFSIVASLSYESTDSLHSYQRDFAKTGFLEFEHENQDMYTVRGSNNAVPGNAEIRYQNPEGYTDAEGNPRRFSQQDYTPYLLSNGSCAPNTAINPGDTRCVFDFTSTLEIYPEQERTALMLQAAYTLTDDIEGFVTLNATDYSLISRIAPNPVGGINIGLDSPLYTQYGVPHIDAPVEGAVPERFRGHWRALSGGNRTEENEISSLHTITGFEGTLFDDIDFNTALVFSRSQREASNLQGFFHRDTFLENVRSGAIDIFLSAEEFAENERATTALEESQLRGLRSTTETQMISFDFRASQALFELPAGEVYVGYGVDFRDNEYEFTRSAANVADIQMGDGGGDFDYSLSRSSYGVFSEFQIPVLDNLSANVALRYDSIGSVSDSLTGRDIGQRENDTTYKVSLRYNPTDDLVVRASYGTGFKMGSLTQYARPLSAWGVTGSNYTCPVPGSDPRAEFCPAGLTQYQAYRVGSEELKPETSVQSSIGFVYAPTTDFSFELDYWSIEVEDMIQLPSYNYMFDNVSQFDDKFVVRTDRDDSSAQILTVLRDEVNIGKYETSGIDWKVELNNDLSFGSLKTVVQGTYITDSEYTRPGVFPYEWTSSLGKYGEDEDVVFRNVFNIQNSLTHGDFTHTLRLKYKSGWHDDVVTVGVGTIADPARTNGALQTQRIQQHIPSYHATDYRVDYYGFENTTITFGINNLFDKAPPFSLADPEGHLIGYEGRYYDQFLRTYYISAEYSF
ncbi:TonB-dependent receptor domain-containing protein [Pseudoalteromonas luteoviolacea]|uniref:TonB-denpendent receptor n=1 Tax=Pseudoalteromonas luteoviolacea H33 TaxID=1365251 RepID=A0A167G6Y0_9GAMM|nr:TonB-dependent receptor [Pseudoalteromonas luteoviolacea]KZN54180.1 hypothetical protein N476_08270 [Pseudoalteromonas luteoviolacea H33]KZN78289.1 hypothetical protein N477_09255 [Pseudoalteromonas luteoviolacea H33-S]MBQ4877457.1 TonB-dependent receptor [Pseudoalteromonas luteoviolacea]MBQ4906444.1 TonB-dependent receptor [Pseudoalteromonas luteoviolacea]